MNMAKNPTDRFHGVFAALVTPMTDGQEVDFHTLAAFTDYLIGEGRVHGLAPLGSTGEYYALSADERRRVLETVLEAAAGRVPIVAGANAGSTREVVRCCREAEQLGAADLRVQADLSDNRMNAKIRLAQTQKVPDMLVVGEQEANEGAVSVRLRTGDKLPAQSIAEFTAFLRAKTDARELI